MPRKYTVEFTSPRLGFGSWDFYNAFAMSRSVRLLKRIGYDTKTTSRTID